jgi:hypothetical protein
LACLADRLLLLAVNRHRGGEFTAILRRLRLDRSNAWV